MWAAGGHFRQPGDERPVSGREVVLIQFCDRYPPNFCVVEGVEVAAEPRDLVEGEMDVGVDAPMLDAAEARAHGCIDSELFREFPAQGLLRGLSRFHRADRELPLSGQAVPRRPAGDKHPAAVADQRCDDLEHAVNIRRADGCCRM